MGSIDRYIFRTRLGAFLLVLVGATAVMGITQALPDTCSMTNHARSIWVFAASVAPSIPLLVLIVAFARAIAYRLGGRSAIAVLCYAPLGAPRTLFSAIGALALLRGFGFVGALAPHLPAALSVPYMALALGSGHAGISGGLMTGAPAFVAGPLARFMEPARVANLAGRTQ